MVHCRHVVKLAPIWGLVRWCAIPPLFAFLVSHLYKNLPFYWGYMCGHKYAHNTIIFYSVASIKSLFGL